MGLFSIDSIKFAEYVLAVYGGGAGGPVPQGKRYQRECDKLIKKCKEEHGELFSIRIYLLDNAGDRINPRNSYEENLKIQCYNAAGSTSRKKLINALPNFLEKQTSGGAEFNAEHFYLSTQLAKSYRSERRYQEAIDLYLDLYKRDPQFYYVVGAADCLIDAGRAKEAMEMLVQQKQTKQYHEKYIITFLGDVEKSQFKKFIDRSILKAGKYIVKERDAKNYKWVQDNLPDICPKSFSAYRRMKNQKTKNFMILANKCLNQGLDVLFSDENDILENKWNELVKAEREEYEKRLQNR